MSGARRVDAGLYHYRGYEIEEVGRYDGSPAPRWNVRHLDEGSAHDTFDSLRDAKRMINCWTNGNQA